MPGKGIVNKETFIEVIADRRTANQAFPQARYFAGVHATATLAGGTVLVRRGGVGGAVLYTLTISAAGTQSLHASGLVDVQPDGGFSVTKDANISEFTAEFVE